MSSAGNRDVFVDVIFVDFALLVGQIDVSADTLTLSA